jgi:hypothetical protein
VRRRAHRHETRAARGTAHDSRHTTRDARLFRSGRACGVVLGAWTPSPPLPRASPSHSALSLDTARLAGGLSRLPPLDPAPAPRLRSGLGSGQRVTRFRGFRTEQHTHETYADRPNTVTERSEHSRGGIDATHGLLAPGSGAARRSYILSVSHAQNARPTTSNAQRNALTGNVRGGRNQSLTDRTHTDTVIPHVLLYSSAGRPRVRQQVSL